MKSHIYWVNHASMYHGIDEDTLQNSSHIAPTCALIPPKLLTWALFKMMTISLKSWAGLCIFICLSQNTATLCVVGQQLLVAVAGLMYECCNEVSEQSGCPVCLFVCCRFLVICCGIVEARSRHACILSLSADDICDPSSDNKQRHNSYSTYTCSPSSSHIAR